jgi:hypothetical protein
VRLINKGGAELKIGELVHSKDGRVGRIQTLSEPSATRPNGWVGVLWGGNSDSIDVDPADIEAAFK